MLILNQKQLDYKKLLKIILLLIRNRHVGSDEYYKRMIALNILKFYASLSAKIKHLLHSIFNVKRNLTKVNQC